jgi:hypothetical protein
MKFHLIVFATEQHSDDNRRISIGSIYINLNAIPWRLAADGGRHMEAPPLTFGPSALMS